MKKAKILLILCVFVTMMSNAFARAEENTAQPATGNDSSSSAETSATEGQSGVESVKLMRAPAGLGIPEGVLERAEWYHHQRAYPFRDIPEGARELAFLQTLMAPEARRGGKLGGGNQATAGSLWEFIGPMGFTSGVEPTWGTQSGRVRALAIDPTNTSRLFLGTATGGVWRSTDGGANWTALTDTQETLAIGAVAIDPQNVNTIYAGTGEGNGSYYGVGILKSTNGGTSWTTLNPGGIFTRGQIADIHVDPVVGDDDPIVVCAKAGQLLLAEPGQVGGSVGPIYRSTDGGTNFAGPLGPTCFCTDLTVDPSNFSNQYFSATSCATETDNGIWKSTDAGANWTQLAGGAPSGTGVARRAIGISADGMTIFVGGGAEGANQIHKSTDSGATWTQLAPTTSGGFGTTGQASEYCAGQCDYDNHITVNPNNAMDVFLGGVGLYRSADGGATFTRAGSNNDGGGPLHVDHHEMKFVPGTSGGTTEIYSGNDGGLYKTTDNGATWTSLGANLPTIQAYHVSLHPTNGDVLFQGNQDNGTTRRTTAGGNLWTERTGGDGSFSAISKADPMTVYTSSASLGGPNKSTDGGETFGDASTGLPGSMTETRNFIAPIVLDTSNTNAAVDDTLYAGTHRLWRTTDEGANWAVRSGDLTDGAMDATITNMAIAPSNNQVIYVVTTNGLVQRSADAGQNFTNTTVAPLPMRYATGVAVHPTDPNTAYVTYSGFGTGHVFKTTDAGATWTDVSGAVPPGGGLPDGPVNSVAIRPDVPTEVYVGTDTGVWISTTGGTTWAKMNNGLPNAGVQVLAVNQATNLLVAATYGRSTWKTALNPSLGCPAMITRSSETLSGTLALNATASITLGAELIINGTDISANAPLVTITNDVNISPTFSAGNTPMCP